MHMKSTCSVFGFALMAVVASGSVFAQATQTDVPGHPRVNEVNNRLQNQQSRLQNGVANGTVNAKQESRDDTRDANIAQRESADEAKNGGHLTKKETTNLNRAENRNSKHIYNQKH